MRLETSSSPSFVSAARVAAAAVALHRFTGLSSKVVGNWTRLICLPVGRFSSGVRCTSEMRRRVYDEKKPAGDHLTAVINPAETKGLPVDACMHATLRSRHKSCEATCR